MRDGRGQPLKRRQKILSTITAALLTVLVAVLIAAVIHSSSGGSGHGDPGDSATNNTGFDGAALPKGSAAPGFTLTDQSGRPVSLSEYRGRVVVLAFLYSTCGRVCVVLAQQVRGALDELPRPVPVLFLTAAPEKDTPKSISRFLAEVSLTGRVRYLTGPPAELRPLWRAYHVTPPEEDRAGFDNTISLYLLDRHGDERVLFQLEQLTPEALVHDLRALGAT
jgi:protein SCO1/2